MPAAIIDSAEQLPVGILGDLAEAHDDHQVDADGGRREAGDGNGVHEEAVDTRRQPR